MLLVAATPIPAGYYVWSNEGGPYGGRVQTVEFIDDTVYLAGTWNGGVFISHDSGTRWNSSNSGLTNLIINCICKNPLNRNTVYIGTGGGGVFRTNLAATTCPWVPRSYNLGNSNVLCIAMSPVDTNVVFAGTVSGIYRSLNTGGSWSNITNNLADANVNAVAIGGNFDTLYTGTNSGVFKSTDGGTTWVSKNVGLTNLFIKSLKIDPKSHSIVLAATFGGVFKSINRGESWVPKNGGLGNLYVRDLEIHPDSSAVYCAGTGNGFYISRNGGNSWGDFSGGLTDREVYATAINASGQKLLAGTYWGGTYESVARAPWIQKIEGMDNTFINSVDINPLNNDIIQVTSYGQIFRSDDEGSNWQESSTGIVDEDLTAIAIDNAAPDTVYCGANYGGVYKSVDGGRTWTLMNVGLGSTTVTCVAVDHQHNNIVYAGTYNYLYRSVDGARHWQLKSNGISDKHVWTLEVDPVNTAIVFVGTYGGGVFKTTDSGDNWTAIDTGLPEQYVKAIAVDPVDHSIVYAGTYYGGGVYKSVDGGAHWVIASTGLANRDIWSLDVHPERHQQVIAGTFGGVFISLNGGATWESFSDGLGTLDTRCVVYDQSEARNIFAGTYGGGVYKYNGIYCSVDADSETPGTNGICRLFPNYPNPFNPSTTIRYEIIGRGGENKLYPVGLKIYDVGGRLVKTLFEGFQGSGDHSVIWRGDNDRNAHAVSGVYFSRLTVSGQVLTGKLILIN